MMRRKIALVGCGALGYEIALGIRDRLGDCYRLIGIYTDQPGRTEECAKEFGCQAYDSKEALLQNQPDLLIEAAGGEALRSILEDAVVRGISVIPLSVGVFADTEYCVHIQELAEEHGVYVYLPSGAVGGFDLMAAMKMDLGMSAAIRTEKPPRAFSGAPILRGQELTDRKFEVIFEGDAAEAIRAFPQNVNVAVAVGLATVGVEQLSVTVASNPDLEANRHTIELDGAFGSAKITISAKPSSNAHSSRLAAYSVIGLLSRLASRICFL